MTLKQILVTLEPGAALERRLLHAADVALAHEAHLIGLSVVEPLNLAGYFSPGLQAIVEVEERHRQAAEAAARKVEGEFRSVCARLGITSEWRLAQGDTGEIAAEHARYADLTITGQVNPESPPPGGGAALPERLALTSGRPVLVVPYVGRYETI